MTEYCYAENREKIIKLGKISIGPPWDIMFGSCSQLTTHQSVANAICSFCFRIPCTEESLTKIHHFVANCLKARLYTGYLRDLSEISRRGGGWKQRKGHNFLRLRKGRGHENWAVQRGRVMQIYARDHVEVHPQKKKQVLYLLKVTKNKGNGTLWI